MLHKAHNRKYPPLKEGDQVKIYKKKYKKHQKEHYSVWSQKSYKIDDEIISMGHTFYKIAGFPKMYMRHELVKVSSKQTAMLFGSTLVERNLTEVNS